MAALPAEVVGVTCCDVLVPALARGRARGFGRSRARTGGFLSSEIGLPRSLRASTVDVDLELDTLAEES
jgi:hypothetical protein